MKIETFRDLLVWKKAHELVIFIYKATKPLLLSRDLRYISKGVYERGSQNAKKPENCFTHGLKAKDKMLKNLMLNSLNLLYLLDSD